MFGSAPSAGAGLAGHTAQQNEIAFASDV